MTRGVSRGKIKEAEVSQNFQVDYKFLFKIYNIYICMSVEVTNVF